MPTFSLPKLELPDDRYNAIYLLVQGTDVAVPASLDGEFEFSAGVEPNVNTFTVSGDDFRVMAPLVDHDISILFFFSAHGDIEMSHQGCRIVDAQGQDPTSNADGVLRYQRYRLAIADFREQWVEPRGGTLAYGVVNPQKTSSTRVPKSEAAVEALVPNSELIRRCLVAMGIKTEDNSPPPHGWAGEPYIGAEPLLSDDIPAAVDNLPPLTNLQWRGAHAPTELAKVLEAVGAVLCPTRDPGVLIRMVGQGPPRRIPADRQLPELPVLSRDRRGWAVVISSAPQGILDQVTSYGPSEKDWQYVAEDPDDAGAWKSLDQIKALGKDPTKHIREHGTGLSEVVRDRLGTQLYRCLRLNPNHHSPDPVRWLVDTIRDDVKGQIRSLATSVMAKIALRQPDGLWRNAKEPVQVRTAEIRDGRVLICHDLLMKLSVDDAVADPAQYLVPMDDGEIEVNYSIEQTYATTDDKGKQLYLPRYYQAGFIRTRTGGLIQMSEKEIAYALTRPTTMVIRRPNWILYQVKGVDKNRKELDDVARALATTYLPDPRNGPLRVIPVLGYWSQGLTGQVGSIRITQTPPKTTLHVNTWFLPQDQLLRRYKQAPGEQRIDEAPQITADRLSRNAGGAILPSAPLNMAPAALIPAGHVLVKLGDPEKYPGSTPGDISGGNYGGYLVTGLITGADGKHKVSLPGTMTVSTTNNALVINPDEDSGHRLQPGSFVIGLPRGQTTETPPRQFVILDSRIYSTFPFVRLGPGNSDPDAAPDDPDAAKWIRDGGETAGQAVMVWTVTGVQFTPDGDEKLYAFLRPLWFDAAGHLISAGPETRRVVDTPTNCAGGG